jgi:predicted transcriptional regulator
MAVVNDLLFQLAGSAMDETEIAEELRVDLPTARRCLERLRELGVATGPELDKGRNMWSPSGGEEFPDLVAKAKAAGVNVREAIASFAGAGG